MKKMNNKKGFTLAELLIVVAIIAVLVAIAIPTFTTQLEKSREGVDLANVRSAYAEVKTAALGAADGTYYKEVKSKQATAGFKYVDLTELAEDLGKTYKTQLDTMVGGTSAKSVFVQCVAPAGTVSIVTTEPSGTGVTKID